VRYEGHTSFDQDIGPGLETPGMVVTGRRGDDVLVGGEERDDGLNVLQCFSSTLPMKGLALPLA
jgi:hypothetical protein